MYNFPFGQIVQKVEQKEKTPKKVFILGVYASAVHTKWISEDGKTLINALAVASEPYIFWRGDGVEEIINKIKLPSGAGKIIPANKNLNGPSGKVLDTKYLNPLGITRKECWLCDLVPFSLLNTKQATALEKHREIFIRLNLKKQNMLPADLKNRKIDGKRRAEIVSEIRKSKAKYLITLGNEPLTNFVKYYHPSVRPLNQEKEYGNFISINIDDIQMELLALAHPRQAGGLGGFNKKWYDKHQEWISNNAKIQSKVIK